MHKYVIMGIQASGKGRHAELLGRDFDLVHISVGDILRRNVQHHTKIGAQVAATLAAGSMVSDDLVDRIVRRRLKIHDWNYGFVIDGFPRTAAQAEFFLRSYDIDAVIHLDLPDAEVTARISARRVCTDCGRDYNLVSRRPKEDGVCDICRGPVDQRPDDNPEALEARIREYRSHTVPLLDLFRQKELVLDVDASPPVDEVQQGIRQSLGLTNSGP